MNVFADSTDGEPVGTPPGSDPSSSREAASPSLPIQYQVLRSELESLRRQRDDSREELRRLQERCEELTRSSLSSSRLRLLRSEMDSLRRQRDEAREEYRRLTTECEGLRREVLTSREAATSLEAEAVNLARRWDEARREAVMLRERCDDLIEAAARDSAESPSGRGVPMHEHLALTGELEELRRQRDLAREEIQGLRETVHRLKVALAEAEHAARESQDRNDSLTARRVELERAMLPPSSTAVPEDELEALRRDRGLFQELVGLVADLGLRKTLAYRAGSLAEIRQVEDQFLIAASDRVAWEKRRDTLLDELRRLSGLPVGPGQRPKPVPSATPSNDAMGLDSVARLLESTRAQLAQIRQGDTGTNRWSMRLPPLPRRESFQLPDPDD